MRLFAVRLHTGELLKESIERVVAEQHFSAATVVSAVGSLSQAVVRMAGAAPDRQDVRTYRGGALKSSRSSAISAREGRTYT